MHTIMKHIPCYRILSSFTGTTFSSTSSSSFSFLGLCFTAGTTIRAIRAKRDSREHSKLSSPNVFYSSVHLMLRGDTVLARCVRIQSLQRLTGRFCTVYAVCLVSSVCRLTGRFCTEYAVCLVFIYMFVD